MIIITWMQIIVRCMFKFKNDSTIICLEVGYYIIHIDNYIEMTISGISIIYRKY